MTPRSPWRRSGIAALACGLLAGALLPRAGGARAATAGAAAADSAGPAVATAGWVDADADDRHDRFRDADGDGVNDVTGQAYAHHFAWLDRDRDRLNDVFRDADGDGVNDLARRGESRPADVLDADADRRNDVTGLEYTSSELHGERYGFVREGADGTVWVDEDGDGFPDRPDGAGRRGREDRFIDRDGDGLADGCWFQDGGFRHHQAQGGQGGGGQGGGGQGGGGSGGGGLGGPAGPGGRGLQ